MATRQIPEHSLSPFVKELTERIEKWAALIPPSRQAEFQDDFQLMAAEHERQLEVITKATMQGYATSVRDEVTGLVRRRYFLEYLRGLLTQRQSTGVRAIGVVLLDLDDFKPINDTYGHDAGDRALAAVGGILKAAVRVERKTDVVAHVDHAGIDPSLSRAGGDEFIALLQLKDREQIVPVTERIRARVNDPAMQKAHGYDHDLRLSASIGAVGWDLQVVPPAMTIDSLVDRLIRLADEEMYKAKKDGLVHVALARFTSDTEIDVLETVT